MVGNAFAILIFIQFLVTIPQRVNGCSFGYFNANGTCLECGTSSVSPNVKIVGGVDAVKGSWPAQVLIVQRIYIQPYLYRYSCGGTLISPNTILTAAHCIITQITENGNVIPVTTNSMFQTLEAMFTVYLGAYNISFLNGGTLAPPEVVVSNVTKIIKHESYNSNTEQNDIALLIMGQSITPNSYINIACLPADVSSTFPPSGSASFAPGWGATSEGGKASDILKNVKLTVYSPSMCQNVATSYSKNWNAQICAGEYSGGKDTCQGDSGGGLMVQQTINGTTKYIVAGIVSYGAGCARPQSPGIYTRISYYNNWVLSKMYSSSLPNTIITINIAQYSLFMLIIIYNVVIN